MDADSVREDAIPDGRVRIGDRSLSARQYRWLFTDLTQNLPDGDQAALRHFEQNGRHEIADGRRVAQEDRLLEIQLQQFSPVAAEAEKSPNFAFFPGTADTLDIYFSYPLPGDQFVPAPEHTVSPHSRLLVKETTHSYFQRGIPGVTTSIEETAEWLDRIISWLQPRRLRVIGASAGGYAALVFGHLLSADTVIALSPEVVLGREYYRSRKWFPNAVYNPSFRDVTPMVHGLSERLALIYPVYDPLDYEMIRLCLEQRPLHMAFTPTFHPGYGCMDLGLIARSDADVPPLAEITVQQYDFHYDEAALRNTARAYELMMDREYAASLPMMRELYALDPANYGFLCHIGFHEAVLGQREQGLATMRAALQGILDIHRHPDVGRGTRHTARALVRYYYDADRKMIAALERFWDEAAAASA